MLFLKVIVFNYCTNIRKISDIKKCFGNYFAISLSVSSIITCFFADLHNYSTNIRKKTDIKKFYGSFLVKVINNFKNRQKYP